MSLIKQPFGFGAGGRADMSDIPQTNLIHHWRADTGVTLSGSLVTDWEDQKGSEDWTQGTNSKRPTYSASSGPNDLDGITFDGSNDALQNTTINRAQPFHLFLALKLGTQAAQKELWVSRNPTAVQLTSQYPSGQDNITLVAGLVGPQVSTWSDDTAYLVAAYADGASSTLNKNNGTPAAGNAGTNGIGNGGTPGMTLAANGVTPPASWAWCNYTLSEFAIYSSEQTGSTLTSIQDYMNGQYGLW